MKLLEDIYYIVKYSPENIELKITNNSIFKYIDTIKLENNKLYINRRFSNKVY